MDTKEAKFWGEIFKEWSRDVTFDEHCAGIRFSGGWVVLFEDRFFLFSDRKRWGHQFLTNDPFPLVFELLVRLEMYPRSIKAFIKKHAS